MDKVRPGQIEFALHSTDPEDDPHDTRVSAAVFAAKLGALVRALKAADRAMNNGRSVHDYTIARLHTSTPTALLKEHVTETSPWEPVSGIDGFVECATAIQVGDRDTVERYGDTAAKILTLTMGAGKTFGYGEATATAEIIRLDPFLKERAAVATKPSIAAPVAAADWFVGKAHGTFVGEVKEVDLRGSLPGIKMVLSAGGKQLDCVVRGLDIDEIREALNRRVRVTGTAIYDGKSGLPRRVEILQIEHFKAEPDITRWAGAFESFEPDVWPEDAH